MAFGKVNFLRQLFRRKAKPLDNVTPRIQLVFLAARNEADRYHHGYVGPHHLWGGLLRISEGVAIDILRRRGIDPVDLRTEYEATMIPGPPQEPRISIPYTPTFKAILKSGDKEAGQLGFCYFGTEHLLLGFLTRRGLARDTLKKRGLDLETARDEVSKKNTT